MNAFDKMLEILGEENINWFRNYEEQHPRKPYTILLGTEGMKFFNQLLDDYYRELQNTPNTSRNCKLKLKDLKKIESVNPQY